MNNNYNSYNSYNTSNNITTSKNWLLNEKANYKLFIMCEKFNKYRLYIRITKILYIKKYITLENKKNLIHKYNLELDMCTTQILGCLRPLFNLYFSNFYNSYNDLVQDFIYKYIRNIRKKILNKQYKNYYKLAELICRGKNLKLKYSKLFKNLDYDFKNDRAIEKHNINTKFFLIYIEKNIDKFIKTNYNLKKYKSDIKILHEELENKNWSWKTKNYIKSIYKGLREEDIDFVIKNFI